jgi:hypothetical protein
MHHGQLVGTSQQSQPIGHTNTQNHNLKQQIIQQNNNAAAAQAAAAAADYYEQQFKIHQLKNLDYEQQIRSHHAQIRELQVSG